MIQELSWYTKSTGNTFFSDLHFRAYNGRSYQLSYNGNTGYVISAGKEIKRHEKIAHAMLGDTQLFLQNDGSSFIYTFNIYDYKTNGCIGKLNRLGFIIHGIQYTLRQTRRSIFSKQFPCDLRFEVDRIYPDMLMRMDIHRVDKKWYKGVYGQALKGTVEFQETIPREVILATFFFLHTEIEAHTRD